MKSEWVMNLYFIRRVISRHFYGLMGGSYTTCTPEFQDLQSSGPSSSSTLSSAVKEALHKEKTEDKEDSLQKAAGPR